METTTTQTKVCSRCGQEYPIDYFAKNKECKDGHIGQCKYCKNELARERNRNRGMQLKQITPPYSQNPDLSDKQPREIIAQVKTLINELRARGYNYEGKLTYLQTINL